MQHINLTAINFDSATQTRFEIDDPTVNAYAEAMAAGEKFPPATLFKDGSRYIIGDGWHRLLAAQKNGDVTFPCEISEGNRREAIKFALRANATHGKPRTNADKRKAVVIALKEFADHSDRSIAELCAVSPTFAGKVRAEQLSTVDSSQPRLGSDGKYRKLPDWEPYPPQPPKPWANPSPVAPAKEAPAVSVPTAPEVAPEASEQPANGAPWSLPKWGEDLRVFLKRYLGNVPFEQRSEAKWYGAKVAAEIFAPSASDPKPEPWGPRNVIPPLPEWVTTYSASINYPMNGAAWCDQYQTKGWSVGKVKMKDWQSAVRNWKTNGWGLGNVALAQRKPDQPRKGYSL
jgi:hypothetical protein